MFEGLTIVSWLESLLIVANFSLSLGIDKVL